MPAAAVEAFDTEWPNDAPWPERRRQFLQSLIAEVKGRLPWYADDWIVGLRHPVKVVASGVFMFFVSIFPALTFGNELAHRLKMQYGIVEVILSSAVCGALFAIFAGQPLVIVGVTGPITAFSISVYRLADTFNYEFLALMFWTCFWSGLMHITLAAFNFCDDIIKYVTRFTCEIFGILIAIIYIVNGFSGVVHRYEGPEPEHMAPFLLVVLNTLVVTILALKLSSAQSWWLFTPQIRFYIADWGVSFSVIVMWILVSYTPPWNNVTLRELPVPTTFTPSTPRPWLVNPLDAPPAAIAFALLPAFILTVLLYFDHNVSSLLAQTPQMNLKKPPAYNFDFLIIGVSVIICGALGIPPAHGLIPQAVLHVESLNMAKHTSPQTPPHSPARPASPRRRRCCGGWFATRHHDPAQLHALASPHHTPHMMGSPLTPEAPFENNILETRISGLLQSVLIGLTLLPPILKSIRNMPPSLLYGTFIYMGVASFAGNQFFARALAITITHPAFRLTRYLSAHISPLVLTIPPPRVLAFTFLQLLALAAVTAITLVGGPAAISFPVLIVLLIPLRNHLFPKFFTPRELSILDSWSTPQPAPPPHSPPRTPPRSNPSCPDIPSGGDQHPPANTPTALPSNSYPIAGGRTPPASPRRALYPPPPATPKLPLQRIVTHPHPPGCPQLSCSSSETSSGDSGPQQQQQWPPAPWGAALHTQP